MTLFDSDGALQGVFRADGSFEDTFVRLDTLVLPAPERVDGWSNPAHNPTLVLNPVFGSAILSYQRIHRSLHSNTQWYFRGNSCQQP